ncbi:MAG: hypothetical protein ACFB0D_06235 [Phormidesmis sp.]
MQAKIKVDTAVTITFSIFFSWGVALPAGLRSQLALPHLLFSPSQGVLTRNGKVPDDHERKKSKV